MREGTKLDWPVKIVHSLGFPLHLLDLQPLAPELPPAMSLHLLIIGPPAFRFLPLNPVVFDAVSPTGLRTCSPYYPLVSSPELCTQCRLSMLLTGGVLVGLGSPHGEREHWRSLPFMGCSELGLNIAIDNSITLTPCEQKDTLLRKSSLSDVTHR